MRRLFASFLVALTAALFYFPDRGTHKAHAAVAGLPYTLVQMNLCLSGQARCFQSTQYPLGVEEAVAQIIGSHADAVTLNEVCSGDVEEIARVTSYNVRFATVRYRGALLPCRNPGNRGVFGIAVLTNQSIVSSTDRPFQVQDGVEERRWMCATTGDRVTVCATHLS
ncbi:MAG: hypothetical protein ABJA81_10520, partial [Nocardioidaceae bacterium]